VKLPRIEIAVRYKETAKPRIIMTQHPFIFFSTHRLPLAIDRGMKRERGVWIDANISYGEKHGTGRSAIAFDAEQFTGLIVLGDDPIDADGTAPPP
jgi:hypothetical protein